MKEWLTLALFLSEPILVAGYLCYTSYRRLRTDGKKFTYAMSDLVAATFLIGVLLWMTVAEVTRVRVIDNSELRLMSDSELGFYLVLVWTGALAGAFMGRCYAIRNAEDSSSPSMIILSAFFGVVGIFFILLPWALLWAFIRG